MNKVYFEPTNLYPIAELILKNNNDQTALFVMLTKLVDDIVKIKQNL